MKLKLPFWIVLTVISIAVVVCIVYYRHSSQKAPTCDKNGLDIEITYQLQCEGGKSSVDETPQLIIEY